MAFAFHAYEAAKTFFIVPLIAAATVPEVPVHRRLTWVGCGAGVAWLVLAQQPMTTQAALGTVRLNARSLATAALASFESYAITTYIDFPATALAGVIGLVFLRRNRLFWTVRFVSLLGMLCLNYFYLNGAFLIPQRFLLLGFISALIASIVLSQSPPRFAAIALSALL